MTEKYCPLPKSICEFGTNKKADCENCELNKRYTKRTVDNWESYIVDNKTGEEYGNDINPLLDLLNEQYALIKRLKTIREEQIQTILKQKRKIKELTAQLKTDEEDVCIKCKHHYLINYPESSKYYISKCKKEHEECSKEYIRFCEDFEFELGGDLE